MWLNLGTLLAAEDAHEEAIEAYRRAAEIGKETDDADGVELAYGAWGNSLAETQRLPEARMLLEQALALARVLGDRARTALRLGNLANVTLAEGDADAALPLRSEALALAEEMGDPRTQALQLHGTGQVLVARGEDDQAVTIFAEAERIFGEIGMQEAAGQSRAAGTAAAARRALRSAVGGFQELIGAGRIEDAVAALDRWGALGYEPTTAQRSLLLGLYGFADHVAGRLDAAAERYTAALRLDDGLPPSELTAGHRGNVGDLYRQLGDAEQAELAYRAALAVPDVSAALRERFRRGLELARELRDDPGRKSVDPGQEREAGAP
jgi:tetratricopeptide (TPR) repeat protein